jgi:hypothetical protein
VQHFNLSYTNLNYYAIEIINYRYVPWYGGKHIDVALGGQRL